MHDSTITGESDPVSPLQPAKSAKTREREPTAPTSAQSTCPLIRSSTEPPTIAGGVSLPRPSYRGGAERFLNESGALGCLDLLPRAREVAAVAVVDESEADVRRVRRAS